MGGSFNSGDLLGGGIGRWALAVCVVAMVALLVPIGLASVGFGALLTMAGSGVGAPSGNASGLSGHAPSAIGHSAPTTRLQAAPFALASIQSVVATSHGLYAGWADRSPLNQYARTNYHSDASWLAWRKRASTLVSSVSPMSTHALESSEPERYTLATWCTGPAPGK